MAIRETFSKCFNFNRPHCVWPVCVFFFLHLIHFGGFSIVCLVGLLIGTIFFRIIFNAIVMSYNENVLIFLWAGLYVILPLLSSIWIFRSCVLVNFVNLRSPENAHKPNGYVIKLSNRYYLLFCFVSCTLKHFKQKCIFFPPDFNVQGYDTRATDYSNAHTHIHPISRHVKSLNDIVIVCVRSQHTHCVIFPFMFRFPIAH